MAFNGSRGPDRTRRMKPQPEFGKRGADPMPTIRSLIVLAAILTIAPPPSRSAAEDLVPRPEHPRPEAARTHYTILNGKWDFKFDPEDKGVGEAWFEPGKVKFEKSITVPFGWESELSGVHDLTYRGVAWYRKSFGADSPANQRTWLRFEAVDYQAKVWVNGKLVAEHEGGYTPFEADVSDSLSKDGMNEMS